MRRAPTSLARPYQSFGTKLRVILGVVMVVAAVPIPVTAMLRDSAEAKARAAEASISGLDRLMYLSTSINTLQVNGSTYAQNPVPYNREKVVDSLDSAGEIVDGIDFRSGTERARLEAVVRNLQTATRDLDAAVRSGDAVSAQRRFVLQLRDEGNTVSDISINRALDGQRSQREIRAEVRRRLLEVHLLLMLAVSWLAIAAWVIPKRLTARLARLETATRELAAGSLGQRVEVSGEDEVGRLARSFEAMSMALALRESENRQLIAEQIDRATRDSLTNLRNNRYFHTTLQALLDRQDGREMAVAVLDLDNFKLVNDTYGHAEGDAVLLRLASTLTDTVRRADVCCRLGGEEFAVIFPDCDEQGAADVIARIARNLRATDPEGRATTFSCGVASSVGGSAEDLFKLADACAYEAKRAGKNRIVRASAPRPTGEARAA